MKLWLREFHGRTGNIHFDREVRISSQVEWLGLVERPEVLGSVLWAEPPLFPLQGPHYHGRRHGHEKRYTNNRTVNASYREGCIRLASRLQALAAGKRCLVYAPLRGALPIWQGISGHLAGISCEVHYPVTSSFVFYPERFRVFNQKGRPASGRFSHRLELTRLKPLLEDFDLFVYVDEIVSGGMMTGYLRDMFALGIDRLTGIVAVGLADRFGERSLAKRRQIERFRVQGRIRAFLWEGCASLITQDQRYLLGMHYVDYRLGPHAVPLLVGSGPREIGWPPEKLEFDRDLFSFS